MLTFLVIINTALLVVLIFQKTNLTETAISGHKIVLDTSALIDGRIVDIVASGFLTSKLVVSQFVIDELQHLADGSNSLKRERARFGLDNVKALQESRKVEIEITTVDFLDESEVDTKLVKLSLKLDAHLLTTDFNLMKVADISGVSTMNINELAQSLRTPALPGEVITVNIVQKGSGRDQGVGYLDDGTMVVVSGAFILMGKDVNVEITRSLQTAAGRMMFAELVKKNPPHPDKNTGSNLRTSSKAKGRRRS